MTDLAWSSNGLVIAVSYGSNSHEGVCHHASFVSIWNISRNDFNPKVPRTTLKTEGCIMALGYNPGKPANLAGGNFNGKLFVWDTSEGTLLFSSSINPYFHIESITKLLWID